MSTQRLAGDHPARRFLQRIAAELHELAQDDVVPRGSTVMLQVRDAGAGDQQIHALLIAGGATLLEERYRSGFVELGSVLDRLELLEGPDGGLEDAGASLVAAAQALLGGLRHACRALERVQCRGDAIEDVAGALFHAEHVMRFVRRHAPELGATPVEATGGTVQPP